MSSLNGKSAGARLEGGRLLALLAGLLVAMAIVILAFAGITADGLHTLLKATARTSALLYFAAFAAPGTAWLRWGSAAWLERNERPLFLAFGVSHLVHLAAILGLAAFFPEALAPRLSSTVAGTVVYLIIALMCIRLILRPAASPGEGTIWRVLEYLVWLVFAFAFIVSSRKGGMYPFFAVAAIISLVIRLSRRQAQGRGAEAAVKNP